MSPTESGLPGSLHALQAFPWAIGIFIMEWGKHEAQMTYLISTIERKDYMSVRDALLDSSIEVYEKRLEKAIANSEFEENVVKRLREIIRSHISARSVRHDLAHGFWEGVNRNHNYWFKRKVRGQPYEVREYKFSELMASHQALQNTGSSIVEVLDLIRR